LGSHGLGAGNSVKTLLLVGFLVRVRVHGIIGTSCGGIR
jgi:hypothetical protein